MKLQCCFLPATAAVLVVVGCSSTTAPGPSASTAGASSSTAGSSSSTAGSSSSTAGSGTGGSSGTGTAGTTGTSCDGATACGGDAVGTWTVASSCLKVAGPLDVQMVFGLTCPSGDVSGSLNVAGSFTANKDGTFTDNTTTTGTLQVSLPVACLTLSGAPVTCERLADVMSGSYYSAVTCTAAATGGCACTATVNQSGSLGHSTSDPQKNGNYTTGANAITVTQDSSSYSYCVAGNKLTLSPQALSPATTGTIVLQSGSSDGTGGSSGGSGGSSGGGSAGAGAGGVTGTAGSTGSAGAAGTGSMTRGPGPCDIYATANTPCGAAYSMVRALSSKYTGPLYQVRNMSSTTNTGTGGTTKDIGMTADGYADSAMQDAFCTGTTCTVSKLYDQSGNKNDLSRGPAGLAGNGTRSGNDDYESTATKVSVTAGGHKVYALGMAQYEGYRTPLNVKATGVALGNKDQGIYELADGTHAGDQCCWDFGSVSPDPTKYVTMNTIFFGKGFWGKGAGTYPWFMGDFEGGVWAGGTGASTVVNSMNPSMSGVNFALGILHTPVGKYALRMANIATATDLTTAYDGAIVSGKTWGNAGGIALGIGGDNSNNSYGNFYEGAMTNGSPTNATDLLIMKNIQAVGYKK
ncbi:MAG: arabinofuranosidase catalytic domain-containing protein [Polyangiaceae bacterium]